MRGVERARDKWRKAKGWRGRAWVRAVGDVESIEKMDAWDRTRRQQAKLSAAKWPQRKGRSFSFWDGFGPLVPTAVAGLVTRECGVGIVIAALIGGYVVGQGAVWVLSWVVFVFKATPQMLTAARKEIEERVTRVGELTGERDELISRVGELQEKLVRAEASSHVNIGTLNLNIQARDESATLPPLESDEGDSRG